jgi:precorrin-2 dehydrogenase / sirohydrochlorin ferrochelatase
MKVAETGGPIAAPKRVPLRGPGENNQVSLFPMFLKLTGRACLVVGGGSVGEGKIRTLLPTGARLLVVAPHANPAVVSWAESGLITWEARSFTAADLDGMFLVIAATSSVEVNDLVFREAQRRGVLCNVVDDPVRCDFYYPAVVRRGSLQIAISTEGQSPALAQRLRRELENQFGPEYARWVEHLGEERKQLLAQEMDYQDRRCLLHRQARRAAFERFVCGFRPEAGKEDLL